MAAYNIIASNFVRAKTGTEPLAVASG